MDCAAKPHEYRRRTGKDTSQGERFDAGNAHVAQNRSWANSAPRSIYAAHVEKIVGSPVPASNGSGGFEEANADTGEPHVGDNRRWDKDRSKSPYSIRTLGEPRRAGEEAGTPLCQERRREAPSMRHRQNELCQKSVTDSRREDRIRVCTVRGAACRNGNLNALCART